MRNCQDVVSERYKRGLSSFHCSAVAKANFLALSTKQTTQNKFKKANYTTNSIFVASLAPKQVYINSLKTASFYCHVGILFRSQFFRVMGILGGKISGSLPAPLMTVYYGGFSTSTSKCLGQILSTNINTSCKRILTCLSNNEKIEKIIWAKCSPVSAPPSVPLHPQPPSRGWVMGSRVSAECPTLTGSPLVRVDRWGWDSAETLLPITQPHEVGCGGAETEEYFAQIIFSLLDKDVK